MAPSKGNLVRGRGKIRYLISGATGYLGTLLRPALIERGHDVVSLVRRPTSDQLGWDSITSHQVSGFEGVIHLAGENIQGRWTRKKRARIRSSRVDTTMKLATLLAESAQPPGVLICASGSGWYGDRGEEILDEKSECGVGFFPQLCTEWEAAAEPARQRGIRVAHLRLGLVLGRKGPLLARTVPLFRWGLGAPLTRGHNYMPWISEPDLIEVISFLLSTNSVDGPVNIAAPEPVTNRQFTRLLGRILRRPTWFGVPRWILLLLFGRMVDHAVLPSARMVPGVLLEQGFEFQHPTFEKALREALGRPRIQPSQS